MIIRQTKHITEGVTLRNSYFTLLKKVIALHEFCRIRIPNQKSVIRSFSCSIFIADIKFSKTTQNKMNTFECRLYAKHPVDNRPFLIIRFNQNPFFSLTIGSAA